jgi:hypothetical protein
MTSLTDVYEGEVGRVVGRRQRAFGTVLFLAGAAMVVAAIAMATTGLRAEFGLGLFEAREVAGILAGLGLPAGVVGIFTVLPAGRVVRAAAAIGASVALLGVTLFAAAYPAHWMTADPLLTVATIFLYSLGTLTTVWCMFVALATFKTRNDPGGTARMEITEEGTVRIISGDDHLPGFGSVGLFGRDPDGNVDTQTGPGGGGRTTPTPTSDGGVTIDDGSGGAEVVETPSRARPDEYCGNCTHFEYVKVDGGMVPYCGLAEETMDDIEACEDWQPNH